MIDLALDAVDHGAVRVRFRQWPVNDSKPFGFPDPLAELLIFGLLAETGQHKADRGRAIIGDARHDQRVECLQAGRSQPDIHTRCLRQFPFPYICCPLADEASSGKTSRHRLNRGGRTANNALRVIAHDRTISDPRTRAFVAKRAATGNSRKEIMRMLQRYIAREPYPHDHRRPPHRCCRRLDIGASVQRGDKR